MNFGRIIKKEIMSRPAKSECCKKAFLAGLLRGSGSLYEKDGELGLDFLVPGEDEAMTVASYFRSVFGYEIREISVSEDRLNRKDKYVLGLSGDGAKVILKELGILTEDKEGFAVNLKLYGNIILKECCLKAFMRGLFVASGSCTVPGVRSGDNSGYHAELVFSHYTPALETAEKLAQYDVNVKLTRRKGKYVAYLRSAEEIKNFTAFLSAPVSVLKLTDLMINRELSNKSNRQKNCDLGNVGKQVEAAQKQINAIKKIRAAEAFDSMREELRETAKARENNADDTLGELAEKLGITKSCLNHRLRKITEIAEKL